LEQAKEELPICGSAMLFVMEVQPVPPIVVIEGHDFMFYESVEALVADLEPWYRAASSTSHSTAKVDRSNCGRTRRSGSGG
jgi:hypothetical protein